MNLTLYLRIHCLVPAPLALIFWKESTQGQKPPKPMTPYLIQHSHLYDQSQELKQ